jgi:CspA family cold shock protein
MFGTIKFFNIPKGYGFILSDGGEQYFMHRTNFVRDSGEVPTAGMKVRFDVGQGFGGRDAQAIHVQAVHTPTVHAPAEKDALEGFTATAFPTAVK